MPNALLLALTKGKGKGPASSLDDTDSEPAPSGDAGKDYKQLAKDAAKDGDWDAMIDAICGYVDAEESEEASGGEGE